MARQRTRAQVHDAVLALAREHGPTSLTMEGIAARAGIGKQTLYRSWPSTGAVVFDALLARSEGPDGAVAVPDSGDLAGDLRALAAAMVEELTDPSVEQLLRSMAAAIQADAALADRYREQLLGPQMSAIAERLGAGGIADAEQVAELFAGAILHRWLLRSGPFDEPWVSAHVELVLRASKP